MKGFVSNIEKDTIKNNNFRKVVFTAKHSQLALMSLKPKEDIDMEVHPNNDQFFRFESGKGKCIIDGESYDVSDGFAVIIPAGSKHNVINTSLTEDLKMYTLYCPAHHVDGIVRATKEEANSEPEELNEGKKKVLKKTMKKYKGKGGPMNTSSYGQASNPINLLKAGPTPPTVSDK